MVCDDPAVAAELVAASAGHQPGLDVPDKREDSTMMRTLRWTLALLPLVVGTAYARDEAGRSSYLRYCAACHGRDGHGDGPVAPALAERPTDLTQLAVTNGGTFALDAVVEAIDGTRTVRAHGVSEMPVWGEVFQPNSGSPSSNAARATRS
jgi:mono/diheme cytochrome c family protein